MARNVAASPRCGLAARVLRGVLSGALLAAASARAEAPVLSQEFWNYMVEFGDGKGDVFDPSDFAAVANLPAKAREEMERSAALKRKQDEQQRTQDEHGGRPAALKAEEQPR